MLVFYLMIDRLALGGQDPIAPTKMDLRRTLVDVGLLSKDVVGLLSRHDVCLSSSNHVRSVAACSLVDRIALGWRPHEGLGLTTALSDGRPSVHYEML